MQNSTNTTYDYILVGSGPAGSCISHRLTENSETNLLLLEAGGPDTHPYIHMPAGFAKLTGERANWGYETTPTVVFPDPDGPNIVRNSPFFNSKLRFFTTKDFPS